MSQPASLAAITAEDLAAADTGALLGLFQRIQSVLAERNGNDLLFLLDDLIKAEGLTEAVKVRFGTDEWDNGFFYDEHSMTLLNSSGKRIHADFDLNGVCTAEADYAQELHEVFADLSEDVHLGATSTLLVDLAARTITHE